MNKTTPKENHKKTKIVKVVPAIVGLEETETDIAKEEPELDPEVMKVLTKTPKKSKTSIDTTDYIPELERGDDLLGSDDL
jgi:hypothetical protein